MQLNWKIIRLNILSENQGRSINSLKKWPKIAIWFDFPKYLLSSCYGPARKKFRLKLFHISFASKEDGIFYHVFVFEKNYAEIIKWIKCVFYEEKKPAQKMELTRNVTKAKFLTKLSFKWNCYWHLLRNDH